MHQYGSTNPLGVNTQTSTIPFGPYFGTKDLLGVLFLLLVFAILVFFYPDLLGYVAVLVGNNHYYDSAVCWNYLSILTTRDVRVVVLWLLSSVWRPPAAGPRAAAPHLHGRLA